MYKNKKKEGRNFPDPLAPQDQKVKKEYGLRYARAIENQWGTLDDQNSLYKRRNDQFEVNRDYANGTQDTTIYKSLLTALNPNDGDGSLLNLDFTPVPILPKFVRIVVNKILSKNPYPNIEAVDPLSSSEKDREKNRIRVQTQLKPQLEQLKQLTGGLVLDEDPDNLPDTLEEAEIFLETNVKTDAEISGQIATNLTLTWNNFYDNTFRRCVNDLASLGMSVIKRSNDPNYGIKTEYVDPSTFIHSQTEDPNFDDITYAGHIKRITIQELKRLAGDQLTEEQYKKIAEKSKHKSYNDGSKLYVKDYDRYMNKNVYGYDEYMVDILEFEFLSVDCMHFEEKENRYGNTGFYYEGYKYKEKRGSIYDRTPHKMDVVTVYGGTYVLGCGYLFGYGMKKNTPKNAHDLTRARLSYSVVSTNLRRMQPKSMVESCVGFADMLQITHLKLQQAIAKAKPDGLIIDIEGLENVQLGKGGELEPLDLHDIYEKTGVFYYRSKNPEGGFQNPPVREIGNSIRNINELIGLYNHYLRMIRDATGINEMMDGTTPKGDTLVGVQQQAIAAGNNAIYDITNASMILFKKVCEDIVRCLQILPEGSVVQQAYANAIGEENVKALSSFNDLFMYNFGVTVQKEMEDQERAFLEQNIQVALAQQTLDLEDAIAIRSLKDINQAERLLIVKRKKRIKQQQEIAAQNSQIQAQQAAQAAQVASQAKAQEMQLQAQLKAQEMQLQSELDIQVAAVRHEFEKELAAIKASVTKSIAGEGNEFRLGLEKMKEDRKDERVGLQTEDQSKLISQRQGKRGEVTKLKETGNVLLDISRKVINEQQNGEEGQS
jgi:signal transduction histidine kinase